MTGRKADVVLAAHYAAEAALRLVKPGNEVSHPIFSLRAVGSKALSLTANCVSPLPGFESQPGHARKLPVTWC